MKNVYEVYLKLWESKCKYMQLLACAILGGCLILNMFACYVVTGVAGSLIVTAAAAIAGVGCTWAFIRYREYEKRWRAVCKYLEELEEEEANDKGYVIGYEPTK